MKRETGDRTLLDKFAKDFASVVERHAKYVVVSGFVAIAHGRSRGTEDIDMIIERLDLAGFSALHKDVLRAGFECVQSPDPAELFNDYLAQNTSIRYMRNGIFIPEMEIGFAKDELDDYQLATRTRLDMTGLDIYFSTIEMNIAFKEELLKSEKDMADAKHLRIVYSGHVNEAEIGKIKGMIRRLRLHGR